MWTIDAQLFLAGVALIVGIEQLWLVNWSPQRRQAVWSGVCALALATQMAANAVVLGIHGDRRVGVPLFVRYAATSMLPVIGICLAATLAGRRWPPAPLLAICTGAALVRLVLWPATHLVYTGRLVDGWPVYGPLPPFLTIPLLVVSFGYVVRTVRDRGTTTELVALLTGAGATTAIALLSFVDVQPRAAEQFNGWVTTPLFAALLFIVARRQAHEAGRQHSMALRQAAVADFARRSLTAPQWTLMTDAEQLLAVHGAESSFVDAVRSITYAAVQRHASEEAVLHRATHDELTGLPNRSQCRVILQHMLELTGQPVTVIHVGLDSMRAVNDAFGHAVGDEMLREIASRMRASLPAAAVVARVDGDEFVVLIDATGEGAGLRHAHVLLDTASQPFNVREATASVTASIGVTLQSRVSRGATAEGLLRDADIAMHRAKSRGGRSVALFDDWMRAELLRVRGMERRLSRAVVQDELVLHYEAIVDLETRTPQAYEALARWHSDGELVMPATWIPVAEATGHITEIGCHLARLAITQVMAWSAGAQVGAVSINVSPRQLRTAELPQLLDRAVSAGLDPARLWLEITESVAVDEVALATLTGLRERGFRIALDDFGTGYSSLHAIGRLPIDILKIDRSFVADVGRDQTDALITATLSIARAFDLVVIAEGIETEQQATRLAALGCRLGQGYLFGRAAPTVPIPAQERSEIVQFDRLPRRLRRQQG